MKYESKVNDFFCGAKATEAEEVTDLSDAPTEIKTQILENDRKLEERATATEKPKTLGEYTDVELLEELMRRRACG